MVMISEYEAQCHGATNPIAWGKFEVPRRLEDDVEPVRLEERPDAPELLQL